MWLYMAQMYSVVLRNPLRYFDISCALIVLEEANGPRPSGAQTAPNQSSRDVSQTEILHMFLISINGIISQTKWVEAHAGLKSPENLRSSFEYSDAPW